MDIDTSTCINASDSALENATLDPHDSDPEMRATSALVAQVYATQALVAEQQKTNRHLRRIADLLETLSLSS